MPEIIIAVQNKLPILAGAAQHIVADNSDYTIRFLFDDQWEEGEKTVYFVRSNGYAYAPVKTVDGVVRVPVQTDVNLMSQLLIGVRQGEVKTSRPCGIAVYPAISNVIKDDAVQPGKSLWEQVLDRLDELEKNGGGGSGSGGGIYIGPEETMPAGTKVRIDPAGKKVDIPQIDDTLTKQGYAADAAAVGQRLNDISVNVTTHSVYVTPQMFGAVGDGVADDTAAIQAAFDNGGYIYFPAGRYKTTDLLTVSKSCRIEMFKPYPQTYKAEYPLSPNDNWMGARIDTYSPNGGMLIGDSVEVNGLFIRAMEGFAGVVLKYDDTVGLQNYPSMTRLRHIKVDIDSPYTIPVSMFDFQPNNAYRHILEDIVLGRCPDAGYCEYGFRYLGSETTHKWAYNCMIRGLCIDLHADYPLYIIGDPELGITGWVFEQLTIQAYHYNRNEADSAINTSNRQGHINLITLKNAYLPTFIGSYLWDVAQGTVLGEIISVENVRSVCVIGCSEHFDAIESYLSPKMQLPKNLNITNLELSVKDNADSTANTLTLFDGTNEKTVDIPKVQMSDDQIGNAVGTWMDANAEPKEVPGKNKFNYASDDCIRGQFRIDANTGLTFETAVNDPRITDWVSNYIEAREGDIMRITCNNAKRNPANIGCYNAQKELIAIMRGFDYNSAQNGSKITAEGTKMIRLQLNTSTYGSYEDRANANVCVTINDPDSEYEDYYTELVGGIGSFMALQSPNGTKYTLTVSDDGVLSAVPAE